MNIKLGLLGNMDVGKSSLSRKFAKRESIDSSAKNIKTTGIDMFNTWCKIDIAKILEKDIAANGGSANGVNLEDNIIRLSIWDTAGQELSTNVNHTYVRGVDGMILVHDLSRKDSFDSIEVWARQVLSLKLMPTVILGNKCDLPVERLTVFDSDFEKMNATFPADREIRI